MTPIPAGNLIVADGEYSLAPAVPGTRQLVEFEVIAGSATVALGSVSPAGTFRPELTQPDGTAPVLAAAGGRYEIRVGGSGMNAIKVTSAAAAQIRVGTTDCED